MRSLIQNERKFNLLKSVVYPGSYKKVELVLRKLRRSQGINLSDKLIASLRFSNSRRARFLASFLNYILSSHSNSISQIYTEKAHSRKKVKFKSKSANLRISRSFRFVALLNES